MAHSRRWRCLSLPKYMPKSRRVSATDRHGQAVANPRPPTSGINDNVGHVKLKGALRGGGACHPNPSTGCQNSVQSSSLGAAWLGARTTAVAAEARATGWRGAAIGVGRLAA